MEVKVEETADGRRLQEALTKLTDCSAKVGWLGGQPYPDGTSVASVAIIQEYGSAADYIPPRPFMRPAIADNEKKWASDFEKGSKKILKDEITIEQLFDSVAIHAAGEIQGKIAEVTEPPLAPATIYARVKNRRDKTVTEGLAKPLIDTKLMFNSVTYVVEKS